MFELRFLSSPWVLLGVFILLMLCTFDFFNRVRGATSKFRFALALIVFLALNALIYAALVVVFLSKPDLMTPGIDPSAVASVSPLIPLLTAFLYFGAGSSRWKILGFEVDLYEQLVSLANTALGFNMDRSEVRKQIFAHEAEYERLRGSLEHLHALIDRQEEKRSPECERLRTEWKAIEQDCGLIESHIADLKKIRETIESNDRERALRLLQDRAERQEGKLRQDLIERLKTHLYSFIVVRAKTRDDVREMLESIPKAKEYWDKTRPIPLFDKPLPHAVVVGLFFGFFVGLVASKFPTGSVYTPWLGAAACGVFSAIFYLVGKTKAAAVSGAVGALAGFSGFVVWATLNQFAVQGNAPSLDVFVLILAKSWVGVFYGGVSGLIIHYFRIVVCPKVDRPWIRALIVAGLGAAGFFLIRALLGYFLPNIPQLEETTRGLLGMALMAAIGSVFLVGLANACKLLGWGESEPEPAPQH
jgi:hypothetical protein